MRQSAGLTSLPLTLTAKKSMKKIFTNDKIYCNSYHRVPNIITCLHSYHPQQDKNHNKRWRFSILKVLNKSIMVLLRWILRNCFDYFFVLITYIVTSPVAIFPPLLHHAITSFLIARKKKYDNSCRRSLMYICMPSVGTFAIEQTLSNCQSRGQRLCYS